MLALVLLALLGGAFWVQYHSPLLQNLQSSSPAPVRLVVFTQPAMHFSYDIKTRKARITLQDCTPDKKQACFGGHYDRFFIPQQTDQSAFWNRVKEGMASWRFNPAPLFAYVHGYLNAWVQKRTDLNPAEWMRLSLQLLPLDVADFAIEQPLQKQTGRSSKTAAPAPEKPHIELPAQLADKRPLVVEILNASGKKGLALALTQYLREQSAKGLLQVDVLQYDNYPTLQETSFITDYSGKLVQVTQVSRAVGIMSEIRSEKSTTAICDSRIVLGKDFQMPL